VESHPQQPQRRSRPAEAGAASAAAWSRALLGLSLILGIVAYRDLLAFDPARSLSYRVESFFFRPSYTSPLVILALSLWLVFRRRERLRALGGAGGPAWLAGVLGLAAVLVLAWATYTGAPDLMVPSLALGGLGVAVWLRGRGAIRVLAVPSAFLLLAIPMPAPLLNRIVYALQLATVELTGWILHRIGVPALVSGTQIVGSEHLFAVIESCSGLRSMETLTIIAVLLIDLFRRSGWHAALILLVAPPLGFALNGLRAVTLVLNPRSEIAAIHNLQGIAILLGGLLVLYAFDGVLARLGGRGAPRPSAPRRASRGPSESPPVRPRRALALAGAAAVVAAISLKVPTWEPVPTLPVGLGSRIGAELGDWRARPIPVDYQFLERVHFREVLSRRYVDGRAAVDLFVGRGERVDRLRSPLSAKTALPGSGWIVEDTGAATLEPDGRVVASRVVRSRAQRRLVYHWRSGAGGLADESLRSLLALDTSPLRRPQEVMVVRLSTTLTGTGADTRREAAERLQRFYRLLLPELANLEPRGPGKRFS
jgi:EpsI family protein